MGDVMLNGLRSYILENEFRVNIYNNKVDIINYQDIKHFSDKEIIINTPNGICLITGKDLIISKLLNDEILINGQIKSIEFQ